MKNYKKDIEMAKSNPEEFAGMNPEFAVRMRLQNKFRTGLDIARYTAKIMREDMDAFDQDKSKYTKSLGCWHGFIGQQKIISVKKHFQTTKGTYLYLSGWMVAALRSEFGPLPDQSMHEKTCVPDLITELYTFLKQADTRELGHLFKTLDESIKNNDELGQNRTMEKIDRFETHVVPIIADIDAGFGNEEATYLLAKKMIEAGACCIQIENQVSDAKQCGHQDGKVTVPHEDFLAKIKAVRYAFLELGVEDGIIIARTDSLGAGLTQKIPVSREVGDLADQYNSYLEGDIIGDLGQLGPGEIALRQGDNVIRPTRLPNGLYRFKEGSGGDRVVLDCITSLKHGADLLWIETAKPNLDEISDLVSRIKEEVPDAKLVYNNSPSFNWTLNFRQEVFNDWINAGQDISKYIFDDLMSIEYDQTELAQEADYRIQQFHKEASEKAGIFHHLITLPTYHTVALSTDELSMEYFGDKGMLAYVEKVQRKEIRSGLACVKHQDMSGSNIGDDHKEYFSGTNALKAGGKKNTMNQFKIK